MRTASISFSMVDSLLRDCFCWTWRQRVFGLSPPGTSLFGCLGNVWAGHGGVVLGHMSFLLTLGELGCGIWVLWPSFHSSHLSMPFSNLFQFSGPSLMRQVSSAYWRRWMVLSGPSLMRQVSSAYWRRWMVLSGPS